VQESKKSLIRARAQLDNLRLLADAGRAARADALQQEAFVSNSELNVRRAETSEMMAKQSLHELMSGGGGETPNWEVGEDILAPQPGDDRPLGELAALEREAGESRLEIQALEESASALDDQSAVFRSQGYPRVEAFGNFTYANPNSRYIPPQNQWNGSWDMGVRAVWTVNALGVKESAAKASDADAAKVRAQRQQLKDALRSEVLSSYRIVEEARLARASARQGVAAAQAAHEDRLQLFQNGRATSLDVLQAETALVNARMNLIDTHIILREAQVRLNHAVGRDVQDVKRKE
jgi:outer membrane protein TolC